MKPVRLVLVAVVLIISSCDSQPVSETVLESTDIAESQVAKQDHRIDICHLRKTDFGRIQVDESALEAHLDHGDGLPGEPIADMPGYQFDLECVAVEACPCFSVSDIVKFPPSSSCIAMVSYPNYAKLACPNTIPFDRYFGANPHLELFQDPPDYYGLCWDQYWPSSLQFGISFEATESCLQNIQEAGRQLGLRQCAVAYHLPDGSLDCL